MEHKLEWQTITHPQTQGFQLRSLGSADPEVKMELKIKIKKKKNLPVSKTTLTFWKHFGKRRRCWLPQCFLPLLN